MSKAPLPANEAERLAALYRLEILDTPAEERFDRITRIAAELFDVPISYVALLDGDRQWFKSSCGLNVSETPRDVSFCSYTINENQPLVIPDAQADERFRDLPIVTGDPHIRFYAGCPLAVPKQLNVGTLCVADNKPREFDDSKTALLQCLATLAQDQLNLVDVVKLQQQVLAGRRTVERANNELAVRNEFIAKALGCYITDEIAAQILESPDGLTLGGDRRKVTILMSDLRGFTPLSEEHSPERVVETLNRYLGTMIDIINKHNGMIDAFIGDAILVVFGVPLAKDNDAERAVACAVEMQLAMESVNRENESHGLPAIQMGVGINTGEVIAGNIGSEKRMKYSVIGSPVNLAARIESLTLGGQILISRSTHQEVKDVVRTDGALRVKLKGVTGPVMIYDIGGIAGDHDLHLEESAGSSIFPDEFVGE
ncbi:MAG: GAF domain-containing protein [Planctomycetaceae bacterium]|nr:GAF domain-containing protein [Planctomycetaceae bacterium]